MPPEALCSPATSPKFSKRCPYGARLAPATGGAPATFSAAAARPPQQSSRRAPGGGFNPRPAPLFLLPAGGRVASQSHSMPGKIVQIVFSDATAAIYVKKQVKGTRSTKRHATRGRNGTDRISLWREILDIIERKKVAVRAPFFLPLYPLFVIRFQSQKKTDLAPIRCAVEKDELPLLSQVQRICEGDLYFLHNLLC